MLGVEDSHEPEARGAVELAGVEENGRDRDFPLELLQQRERSVEREECSDADDEAQLARGSERFGTAAATSPSSGRYSFKISCTVSIVFSIPTDRSASTC